MSFQTYVDQSDPEKPRKLILCFDGTGNTFSGSNADTNVVKLLSMLDRNHAEQFHYYQSMCPSHARTASSLISETAGIGTYGINETSVNKTWFGELQSKISKTIDQGFGTTFDAHVMAGYRFLMRYYETGDKIYIFGFSRGAFTAKFLARMIHKVGLLCRGNEEMVPFAYLLYQRYLKGEIKEKEEVSCAPNGERGEAQPLLQDHDHDYTYANNELIAFSNTFCRKEAPSESKPSPSTNAKELVNVKVFFLGMWDCVNSVAVLEKNTPIPLSVKGTATHVRHAVAVDEFRVKFKPALLAQDMQIGGSTHARVEEDIKEVWFAGNHGDVGGGWPSEADNLLDLNQKEHMSLWQRIVNFWTSRKSKGPSDDTENDRFQLSDISLAWMVREVELVGKRDESAAVKWCPKAKDDFERRYQRDESQEQALNGFIHDPLRFGFGLGFFNVLMWKLLVRWELEGKKWKRMQLPLNMGLPRDIPRGALLHDSLIRRLKNDDSYHPTNNHGSTKGGRERKPCLKYERVKLLENQDNDTSKHQIW
ncbi:sporulation associated protein, partial [Colletotrichum tofieldiae]